MGFGIAFLGYCFLLLHPLGLGVVASPLLAYGFFLASRLERYFAYSSVAALFLLPRGLFLLINILLPFLGFEIDLAVEFPYLELATYTLFFVAWFFMVLYHCVAVRRIAKECEHPKLQAMANRQLYITSLVIFFSLSMLIFDNVIDDPRLVTISYIAYYIALIMNLYFTHTCLVLITSESQYEKDRRYVAEQDMKAAEKRAREKRK